MKIRKNVTHLSAAEKDAFVQAVLQLKKKPSILHPGNTAYGRYDDFAEIHMNAMMAESGNPSLPSTFHPGWAHKGPAFFPWHRVMLYEFEKELQAINPAVTIPYWDWTDPASSPFTTDFMGGNGTGSNNQVQDGPFASISAAHWSIVVKDNNTDASFLQRDFGHPGDPGGPEFLPTTTSVNTALGKISYEVMPYKLYDGSFRAEVEYQLHNLVHRWVSGTMLKMTSPNDPVFFLHHANIDRLWAVWQRTHTSAAFYQPLTGAATGHNLNDTMIFSAMGDIAPWTDSFTPNDVINHHNLNYQYDDEPVTIRIKEINALTAVKILVGIINDGPGWYIGPDGKIHPYPGPGDPVWKRLSHEEQNLIISHAIREIGTLVENREIQKQFQQIANELGQAKKLVGK